jgi:dTMP kinase
MSTLKGCFITLEGGEGAGKSSLQLRLADYLTEKGYEVVKTREPGGSALGDIVRKLLLERNHSYKICPEAELLLFLAARAQHIEEVIEPALRDGKVVLCDRFNDSTIAYQGVARGLDMGDTRKLCQLVCGNLEPQLTLLLDVDPRIGLLRTKKIAKELAQADELDRMESEALGFHEKVREAFLTLAQREPLRIYRIDASNSPQAVLAEAKRAVDELIILPLKHSSR